MTAVTHYTFLRAFYGAALGVSRDQFPIGITPGELFPELEGIDKWTTDEWPIVRDIVCGVFNLELDQLPSTAAFPDGLPVWDGEIILMSETGNDDVTRLIMMPLKNPSPAD